MWTSTYRKADLRELKLLQKVENKQHQDLILKAQYLTDQQTRKFEQEMQVCIYVDWPINSLMKHFLMELLSSPILLCNFCFVMIFNN